jgi:hypothetical protein
MQRSSAATNQLSLKAAEFWASRGDKGPEKVSTVAMSVAQTARCIRRVYPARRANKARSLEKGGGPCWLCAQPIAIGLAAIHSAIAIISMDFKPSTKG